MSIQQSRNGHHYMRRRMVTGVADPPTSVTGWQRNRSCMRI
ncbi:hypothetical protein ACW5DW_08985 [Luteimonas sp. A482]